MITEAQALAATKEFLRHTLHISTSQSMCGNCGQQVTWTRFTPQCPHCGVTWLFVVAGFLASDDDRRQTCENMAPGLEFVDDHDIACIEPSCDYLGRLRVG